MLDRKMYLNIEAQGFVTEVREAEHMMNPSTESRDGDLVQETNKNEDKKAIELVYRMTYMKLPEHTKNKVTLWILGAVLTLALINVP